MKRLSPQAWRGQNGNIFSFKAILITKNCFLEQSFCTVNITLASIIICIPQLILFIDSRYYCHSVETKAYNVIVYMYMHGTHTHILLCMHTTHKCITPGRMNDRTLVPECPYEFLNSHTHWHIIVMLYKLPTDWLF